MKYRVYRAAVLASPTMFHVKHEAHRLHECPVHVACVGAEQHPAAGVASVSLRAAATLRLAEQDETRGGSGARNAAFRAANHLSARAGGEMRRW